MCALKPLFRKGKVAVEDYFPPVWSEGFRNAVVRKLQVGQMPHKLHPTRQASSILPPNLPAFSTMSKILGATQEAVVLNRVLRLGGVCPSEEHKEKLTEGIRHLLRKEPATAADVGAGEFGMPSLNREFTL